MTDYLSRAYTFQLTTVMENLARTAVFKISQIFEDSLRDHQVELARKGEEIAHLKVKLQRAEMMLKDISGPSETDVSITQTTPRKADELPLKESTVPEIDFEVPDDWCIPLDSENVIKEDNPCPSVRLKQFSICLRPISLTHEAFLKIKEPRLRPRHNRDKIDLHEKNELKRKRGRPRIHSPENDRSKDVLINVKLEPSNIEVELPTRRKGRSGNVRKTNKLKMEAHKTQDSVTEEKYQCKFCPKMFDTPFGLSVHDRAHKKCKGCRKIFPFPSVVEQHKVECKYYKKLMKSSIPLPEKKINSSIQQIKGNTSVECPSGKSIIKQYTCKKCMRKFVTRSLLFKHSCNCACQICFKRFSSPMNLNVHKAKVHKKTKEIIEEELSWTKPLDESEDHQKKHFSASEKNIKKCPGGFKCLRCKKVCATKYSALDHYNSHSGKKPYK